MRTQRVWVIGLDGATWSLIKPWAEAGELPVLHRLMQDGAWGNLESTIQPLTPCAWSTFITGTNPGQHGLFDFTRRIPGSYRVEIVNAGTRRGRSLWGLLGDAGRRVAVINVPMTYPPEQVNGRMVAGLDTPGLHSPYTYPASLAAKISDRHVISVSTAGISHAEYLRRTLDAVDARFEVLQRVLRAETPDFLMKVLVETDAIQHCSWHFMSAPAAQAQVSNMDLPGHDAILRVYRRIDRHLGELLEATPVGTTMILMSDHGAGPIDKVVYLDRWLAQQGWLTFQESDLRAELVQRAVGLGQRYLPAAVKARLRGHEGARAQVESTLRLGAMDWQRTRAFAWGNQGNINLNLVGREPQGTVNPGSEAEQFIEEIISGLYELRDPDTGEHIVEAVHRREEIYQGPMTALAPDLLIRWRDDRYVAKTLYGKRGGTGVPSGEELFGRKLLFGRAGSVHVLEQSGTHTMQGICLFYGTQVRAGTRIENARLLDLAPTILRLMDVPIPDHMEGRVLAEAFDGDGFGNDPSARTDSPHGLPQAGRSSTEESPRPCRTIVLGLDGATWDLLDPWMAAGHMPNLAALRSRSAWGRLRSTIPPFSGTAWASFATGVNPGAHGVYDFWTRDGVTTGRAPAPHRPVSSTSVGAPTLWERLSQAGRRVAVLNVPLTYPPRPVNGVLVSGMMTPNEDVTYTYPAELKEQLRVAAGGDYRADPYAAITQSKAFLLDAQRWVQRRERAHRWLLARERWDCFINVIQASDPVQHYFWTFLLPGSPDYQDPRAPSFRELAIKVFQQIDAVIGARVAALEDDTVLILMSDHGAGEATYWFNLNLWLAQEGWLVFKGTPTGSLKRRSSAYLSKGWNLLRRLDVLGLRGRLGNLTRQRLRARLDYTLAPEVDWGCTLAYAGSPSAEAIYLSPSGDHTEGPNESRTGYERLCRQIREGLLALRGPDGGPVVEAVYHRDEIYRGQMIGQAPDLLLETGSRPYIISETLAGQDLFERIPPGAAQGRHRPEGILLMCGPAVGLAGERAPARIVDLAPTILHLSGLPVPGTMDGRVLVDWLDRDWTVPMAARASEEAIAEPIPEASPAPPERGRYSTEDVAAIEERLRALGYLD
jgi:predicted AlkP superfamily phosphohydrolase/phosphomutase